MAWVRQLSKVAITDAAVIGLPWILLGFSTGAGIVAALSTAVSVYCGFRMLVLWSKRCANGAKLRIGAVVVGGLSGAMCGVAFGCAIGLAPSPLVLIGRRPSGVLAHKKSYVWRLKGLIRPTDCEKDKPPQINA